MNFSSWREAANYIDDEFDYSSPSELWTWDNFGDDVLSLENRMGFGDELKFLGYRVNDDGEVYDEFREYREDLGPGMICILTYYSWADDNENAVTERLDDWVKFWQLPGGEARAQAFQRTIVAQIASEFVPEPEKLRAASSRLGGETKEEGEVVVPTLPKVPVMVKVNRGSGEFPPNCSVFFRRDAANFLPTDNLNDLGGVLAKRLKDAAYPEVMEV